VPVLPGSFGTLPASTFRLVKLHGSVDCWWVDGDATGATIVRVPGGGWGPKHLAQDERPPGRTPFIVPPAAGKSHFYRNPLTRELWQRAAGALRTAERTDLVTGGMFGDCLRGRNTSVEVVNPDPDPPLRTLEWLGITGHPPGRSVERSVESCVGQLERGAAMAAPPSCPTSRRSCRFSSAVPPRSWRRWLRSVFSEGRTARLEPEPFVSTVHATRRRPGPSHRARPGLAVPARPRRACVPLGVVGRSRPRVIRRATC